MQGTSPFAYQSSPSFHSSSYLPKLEANFMRDFSCCDLTLPSLHELLQHYEEHHTDQVPPSLQKRNANAPPDRKAALAAGAAIAIKGQGRAQQQPQQPDLSQIGLAQAGAQRSSTPVTPRSTQQQAQTVTRGFEPMQNPTLQDEDTMGDMELDDDPIGPSTNLRQAQYPMQNPAMITQRSQFGQPASSRVPPLDMNALSSQQQHPGIRKSQPTTPMSACRNGNFYQNNPTVSSVNTPTLTTHPGGHSLQQQYYTPDSSAPGTPGELDGDLMGNLGNMSMENMQFMQNQNQYGGYGYANGNEMPGMCIEEQYISEPAKSLLSLNGGFNGPQQPPTSSAVQLGDGQYSENSELARTIREQQKLAGVPDPSVDGGVPKPFHCPVLGCEKAYKNQNGLKYHKSVRTPPLLSSIRMLT